MKLKYLFIVFILLTISAKAANDKGEVYVDKQGVMRIKPSGEEVSYYGVNYTLPFAYSYRAIDALGLDHKQAIDKDVYHFARLGFNAYRIHIWDVEISDGIGNLIGNKHLDLLDYLISKLEERGISVFITTMTNFGNGYPERNIPTGSFSYLYDKCEIHQDKNAIEAQKRYVTQLLNHKNRYTNKLYKEDNVIVAFEINNEPCHSSTMEQTEEYITEMVTAMRVTGTDKPIFYNASHNFNLAQAYFNSPIQGTTYQWYPIGLVSGKTKRGNFLPYVDSFDIPFKHMKGFDNKAKAIYEFDPADIMYAYMYPAIARSFRSQGFQWITQFAYDPIDIADTNSDYQTHFLNLAYTPNKAISMAIAAEVAYNIPRETKFPTYPNDTVFGDFSVSYKLDQSMYNASGKYYYSNSTDATPKNAKKLTTIKGVGSSPIVKYEGNGAYFLDKIQNGIWRLEVMPDVVQLSDPFAKVALDKTVMTTVWNKNKMSINVDGLNDTFAIVDVKSGKNELAQSKSVYIEPGVYVLGNDIKQITAIANNKDLQLNNYKLGEYVAPKSKLKSIEVIHKPALSMEKDRDLKIEATVIAPMAPDSVVIYTNNVSFWNDTNLSYRMKKDGNNIYAAILPASEKKNNALSYNIIVFKDGKSTTFPANVNKNPLDWNYRNENFYTTPIVSNSSMIELFKVVDAYSLMDTYSDVEGAYMTSEVITYPDALDVLKYTFKKKGDDDKFFWRKDIIDVVEARQKSLKWMKNVNILLDEIEGIDQISVGFITNHGFTYSYNLQLSKGQKQYQIPFTKLKQTATYLLPIAYPSFMSRTFTPDINIPFAVEDVEALNINTTDAINNNASLGIRSIWLD